MTGMFTVPRRQMGSWTRFCLVVAGPASYMSTFGVVVLYDLINSTSLFGDYAIALGLSRGFMTAASLRGRLLLLASRSPKTDYVPLVQLVTVASGVGVLLTTAVAFDTEFVSLAALIALVRLAENVFSVHVSWVQVSARRDRAILLSLLPNTCQVAIYSSLFLTDSLILTVGLEAAATLLISAAVVVQGCRSSGDVRSRRRSLVRPVVAFSLASLLNNLFSTALIRFLLGEEREDLAAIAAGFFVVAAVAARLSSSAALFYSDRLVDVVDLLTRSRRALGAIALSGGLCFFFTFLVDSSLVRYGLLSILVAAATFNLLVRHSLALEGSLGVVIVLHSAELLGGLIFFRTIRDLTSLAQFLVVWQVLRLYALVPVWRRIDRHHQHELQLSPAE